MSANAPIYLLHSRTDVLGARRTEPAMIHVGANVAPYDSFVHASPQPKAIHHHDDIAVSQGSVRDGVLADRLIQHRSFDRVIDGIHVVLPMDRWGASPPTIRVADNATPEMVSDTVKVVQILNTALPKHWQLRVDPTPISSNTMRLDGSIIVSFETPPSHTSEGGGEADWWNTHWNNQPGQGDMIAGYVRISPSHWKSLTDPSSAPELDEFHLPRMRDRGRFVIAHEIFHTLGIHHPDPALDAESITGWAGWVEEFLLYPLDRDTLLATHDLLEVGDTPDRIAEKLGPWEDTSIHIRGDVMEDVSFGVALRNGLTQPWAFGPAPWTSGPKSTGPGVMGLTWKGRLLGFTPKADPVAGKVHFHISLDERNVAVPHQGTLRITEMESWSAGSVIGVPGTGATWNDGDLTYRLGTNGNTFFTLSGDQGVVTGAFFGPEHEAMGGVLERDDLTAAFGGRR